VSIKRAAFPISPLDLCFHSNEISRINKLREKHGGAIKIDAEDCASNPLCQVWFGIRETHQRYVIVVIHIFPTQYDVTVWGCIHDLFFLAGILILDF
jgi:hypothetical protein